MADESIIVKNQGTIYLAGPPLVIVNHFMKCIVHYSEVFLCLRFKQLPGKLFHQKNLVVLICIVGRI